jgi:predicted DNA binding CopG/RHH family protein
MKEQETANISLRVTPSLLERVKKKAGMIPLSKIIKRLLEKWVNGEVELD